MRTLTISALAIVLLLVRAPVASAEAGARSPLYTNEGSRSGYISIAPTAEDRPGFHVHVEISVHDLAPNATYLIDRAPDLAPDGLCTGTTWIPTAEIVTSAGGTGAVHVEKTPADLPPVFQSGLRFDIRFRVRTAGLETVLSSDCLTVTAK